MGEERQAYETHFKTQKDQELIKLAISRSPFFSCLDDDQLSRWVAISELKTFRPGEVVILEGCVDGKVEIPVDGTAEADDDYIFIEEMAEIEEDVEDEPDEEADGSEEETPVSSPQHELESQHERVADNSVSPEPNQEASSDESEASSAAIIETEPAVDSILHDTTEQTQPPPPQSGIPRSIYIVRKGRASVWYEQQTNQNAVASLGPGTLFGEGGFLFGRQHSASIINNSNDEPLECYVVDLDTFRKHVLVSDAKKELFHKYAHHTDTNGRLYMVWDDFVGAIADQRADSSNFETIQDSLLSLRIVSSMLNTGANDPKLFLEDFCFFHMLIARPDPEIDIAFLLMDEKQTGQIFLNDLARFLQPAFPDVDYAANFFQRYFGKEGTRSIRQQHFSQFFVDLQRELGKQAFVRTAKGTGYVTQKQFAQILKASSGWRLPQGVLERLDRIYDDNDETTVDQQLGYGDFLAFQEVFGNLNFICNLIDRAQEIKQGPISQSDFKVANQVYGMGGRFSRGQVEIVFRLFDLDGDGYLTYDDAVNVCGVNYARRLVPTKGPGDRLILAPQSEEQVEERLSEEVIHRRPFLERFKTWSIDFGFAAVIGGVGAGLLYPIDLVKTRLMSQPYGVSKLYKNSLDCLMQAYRFEGFMGLYRGFPAVLLGFAPERAIKLQVHDLMLNAFRSGENDSNKAQPDMWLETLAGGAAGACQLLVANPVEITKIRMQMQGETVRLLSDMGVSSYRSPNMLGVIRNLGFPGMYIGASASLLRDVPFSAILFPSYAMFKQVLVQYNGHSEASAADLLLAGTLAGIPAAVLTTPADVIKTRLQCIARPGEVSYTGIQDCAKDLYTREGVQGFFRGVSMRTLRIAPQFGLTVTVYEGLTRLFGFAGSRPPTSVPVDAQEFQSAFSSDLHT